MCVQLRRLDRNFSLRTANTEGNVPATTLVVEVMRRTQPQLAEVIIQQMMERKREKESEEMK